MAIERQEWLGASWKVAAFACYAGLNAIARYLSGGAQTGLENALPVYVIVFFQDLFALLIILPWIIKHQNFIPKSNLALHLFRVVASACAIIAWYFALIHIPLAQAVTLSIIGPVIGVIGAKWFLKEKLGWLKVCVISLSLLLACLIIQPNSALLSNLTNTTGLLFIALASILFAIAKILTRKLATTGETARSLTFYLFIFIVPISLVPALTTWVTPELVHWPWLLLAGALTALAIFCVSQALVCAQISFLAPFDICQFFLNTLIGYVAFMELPEPWVIWLIVTFIAFSLSLRRYHAPAKS